jgi:hypothetical protein
MNMNDNDVLCIQILEIRKKYTVNESGSREFSIEDLAEVSVEMDQAIKKLKDENNENYVLNTMDLISIMMKPRGCNEGEWNEYLKKKNKENKL